MKILQTKFEYGNPRLKFNEEKMIVDFVSNVKDLTYFEEKLREGNYAVYLCECEHQKRNEYVWALVNKSGTLE
jgi:hypothetical protein